MPKRANPTQPAAKSTFWLSLFLYSLGIGIILCVAVTLALWRWSLDLEKEVRAKFEGKKWALPARVYARPLELYEGMSLTPALLDDQLTTLGYRQTHDPSAPGQFNKTSKNPQQATYALYKRGFDYWDKSEPALRIELTLAGGRVQKLRLPEAQASETAALVRLEPEEIGGIYPADMEDRLPVKLDAVPPLLGETLIAVEDRAFMEHHGVSPMAILRAVWVNFTTGHVVQGGSTLTQQLVKNFYLNNERRYKRKLREAVMALIVEKHYSKSDIFETYINEIFLGQSGAREINGFALAAQHYFRQPLNELEPAQIAMLVGLVKGASHYNPWKHPQRALERRNVVLSVMNQQGLITAAQYSQAKNSPLGVQPPSNTSLQAYPAFLDLVKRQLQQDYRIEDLRSEGLRVFTTLSTPIQRLAETSVQTKISQLEKRYKQNLQTAMVVCAVGTGEVLALIGDQNPRFEGFNRALDAKRAIGSLMKPFVFLTALEQPHHYHVGTLLNDTAASFTLDNGQVWSPKNAHDESHGDVPLFQVLAQSYNQATVQLGMNLGLSAIVKTLKAAGLQEDPLEVPSLLLGALDLTPLQVAELYHTLAADGVHTPLRAINEVLTSDGKPLKRYPLNIEQQFSPEAMFALQFAMNKVFTEGTARSVLGLFPADLTLAGKTGTTNDQRDSWFAGFSSELVTTVWVGRDDNQASPVSGASGALQVWAELMKTLSTKGIETEPPAGMQKVLFNTKTGLLGEAGCPGVYMLPLRDEQIPTETAPCTPAFNPKTDELPKPDTPKIDPNAHLRAPPQ